MKLSILSPNLIQIVNHTILNKDLMKMVVYDTDNALLKAPISNPQTYIKVRVFPSPSITTTLTSEQTNIRIYYGSTKIDYVENTPIVFDIITHDNLNLISDPNSTNQLLRLYEIANRITEQFDNQSIGTIGKIRFESANPIPLEGGFQMLRLVGKMMTIGM